MSVYVPDGLGLITVPRPTEKVMIKSTLSLPKLEVPDLGVETIGKLRDRAQALGLDMETVDQLRDRAQASLCSRLGNWTRTLFRQLVTWALGDGRRWVCGAVISLGLIIIIALNVKVWICCQTMETRVAAQRDLLALHQRWFEQTRGPRTRRDLGAGQQVLRRLLAQGYTRSEALRIIRAHRLSALSTTVTPMSVPTTFDPNHAVSGPKTPTFAPTMEVTKSVSTTKSAMLDRPPPSTTTEHGEFIWVRSSLYPVWTDWPEIPRTTTPAWASWLATKSDLQVATSSALPARQRSDPTTSTAGATPITATERIKADPERPIFENQAGSSTLLPSLFNPTMTSHPIPPDDLSLTLSSIAVCGTSFSVMLILFVFVIRKRRVRRERQASIEIVGTPLLSVSRTGPSGSETLPSGPFPDAPEWIRAGVLVPEEPPTTGPVLVDDPLREGNPPTCVENSNYDPRMPLPGER